MRRARASLSLFAAGLPWPPAREQCSGSLVLFLVPILHDLKRPTAAAPSRLCYQFLARRLPYYGDHPRQNLECRAACDPDWAVDVLIGPEPSGGICVRPRAGSLQEPNQLRRGVHRASSDGSQESSGILLHLATLWRLAVPLRKNVSGRSHKLVHWSPRMPGDAR